MYCSALLLNLTHRFIVQSHSFRGTSGDEGDAIPPVAKLVNVFIAVYLFEQDSVERLNGIVWKGGAWPKGEHFGVDPGLSFKFSIT